MFSYIENILQDAEESARAGNENDALFALRKLPMDRFNEFLITLPKSEYPFLSAILPAMASDKVQDDWTGNHGLTLLRQTMAFVRSITSEYIVFTGKSLTDARILDFGCGYGRILRAMMYFVEPEKLYGCDPWDRSIKLCQDAGLKCNLAISDYLPTEPPFPDKFDLIYAFSVFTHLSKRATQVCLDTLTNSLTDNGLLVITIRPVEYWNHATSNQHNLDRMLTTHKEEGFAFEPQPNRLAIDGDITYGKTTMELSWLEQSFPKLKVIKLDHSLDDPFQIIVYLTRR